MEKEEVGQLLELIKENNKILRKMQRGARISSFIRFVYWAIIIGSTAGAYYYLQPYLTQLFQIYEDLNSSITTVKDTANGLPNAKNIDLRQGVFQGLDSLLKNK